MAQFEIGAVEAPGFRDCVATGNEILWWDKQFESIPRQPRSGGMVLGVGVSPRSKWDKR